MMHQYAIISYWSRDDDAFVAEAPELPDCAANGASHEVALRNINEAIELRIQTAHEFGDELPAPLGRRLMFA